MNGFNKGVELSDESYYNLVSHDAPNKHAFASAYGTVNEFFTHNDAGWVSMRYYKWIYQLIALFVFCFSLANYLLKKLEIEKFKVWLFVLPVFIAGWINYDYLPPGLSYNTWSFLGTLLFCSAILIEAAGKKQKHAIMSGLLNGFVFVILLSVKFPNAFFILLLYFFYKVIIWRKYLATSLLSFLFSSLLTSLMIYGDFIEAMRSIADVVEEMGLVKHTGFSIYYDQFIDYLQNGTGLLFLAIQCAAFIFVLLLPVPFAKPAALLAIAYNCIFLFLKKGGNSLSVYNDFTYFLVFFLSVLLLYFAEKRTDLDLKIRNSVKFILFLFLFLPFFMSIGTNNSIFYTASQFGSLYIATAAILLLRISKSTVLNTMALMSLLFSVLILFSVLQGYQQTPYRQTDLKEKNMPLIFSESFKSVYESKDRFVFFAELTAKMKKGNPNKYPIASSFSYVGASLLCELPVLRCFWLPDPGYGLEKVKQHFQFCRFPSSNKMLIFSQKEFNFPGYKNALQGAGMNIDKDFDKCDSVYCKYNQEYVYLYLSKVKK